VRKKKVEAAPAEAAPTEAVAETAPAKPKRVRKKKIDAALPTPRWLTLLWRKPR
jgi:ribonuclease E